jgi:peptidoglycan/LPS O-acetylase OafA/YrhL
MRQFAPLAALFLLIPSTAFACINSMMRLEWTETYPLDYLIVGVAVAPLLMLFAPQIRKTASRRWAALASSLFASLGLGFAGASDLELKILTGYTLWSGVATILLAGVAAHQQRRPRLSTGVLLFVTVTALFGSYILFDEQQRHHELLEQRARDTAAAKTIHF